MCQPRSENPGEVEEEATCNSGIYPLNPPQTVPVKLQISNGFQYVYIG
jgi:hypothetical protein